MERKIYTILTCIFLFVGCASTQNQSRFTENTFFCDNPKLKVQILKNVLKQQEKSQQRSGYRSTSHLYTPGSDEVVGITIWRFGLDSNKEWRSSDEQLVRQIGGLPLDPITINNKTWVKFVQFIQKEYAAFGYFKRMEYNLVAVYSLIKADQYKDGLESFSKTIVLSEKLKRLISQAFDDIEELFVIGWIRVLQDTLEPISKMWIGVQGAGAGRIKSRLSEHTR